MSYTRDAVEKVKDIKCNSCGSNDFKKGGAMMIPSLECNHCGTLVEVVHKIETDLPYNLKRWINGDMQDLEVNNCIIEGNMNRVKGNNNFINGNMNSVFGTNNIVCGKMNKNSNK
jgi:hypothetical protein